MRNQRIINKLYVFYRISDGSHKIPKCASKLESLNNAVKVFKDVDFIVKLYGNKPITKPKRTRNI